MTPNAAISVRFIALLGVDAFCDVLLDAICPSQYACEPAIYIRLLPKGASLYAGSDCKTYRQQQCFAFHSCHRPGEESDAPLYIHTSSPRGGTSHE